MEPKPTPEPPHPGFCWRSVRLLACLLGLALGWSATSPAAAQERQEFAAKMRLVAVGDAAAKVRRTLGDPDEEHDRDTDSSGQHVGVVRVWYYGVAGRNRFPTLGRVYFRETETGREVFFTYGGSPPAKIAGLEESRLREMLAAIGGMPDDGDYDPRRMIVAVNALVGLPKERLIGVLREYLRICPASHGSNVFSLQLLLRALCDPGWTCPPGDFGLTEPAAPKDPKVAPQFPLAVVDDVPLLVMRGSTYEGQPPNPDDDLKGWFLRDAVLRKTPLRPTTDPAGLLERLEKLPPWTYCERTRADRMHLAAQLLYLLNDRPPADEKRLSSRLMTLTEPAAWQEYARTRRAAKWTWSDSAGAYRQE